MPSTLTRAAVYAVAGLSALGTIGFSVQQAVSADAGRAIITRPHGHTTPAPAGRANITFAGSLTTTNVHAKFR